MPLPPRNNHSITLAEASILTAKHRRSAGIGAVKGGMFRKDSLERLLQQEECVAMRYYYALREDEKPTLVLVGVDKDGHDILCGVMLDLAWPCPPVCDGPNPLNRGTEKRYLPLERRQGAETQTALNPTGQVES